MGRDSIDNEIKRLQAIFQSTRPCGTRRYCCYVDSCYKDDFNPRAPVGRDLSCASFTTFTSISIHAPLWDATKAPVSHSIKVYDFNPRAPVGRDFIFNYCCFFADYISIHAPLWDATAIYCIIYYGYIFLTTILIQSIVKKTLFLLLFT